MTAISSPTSGMPCQNNQPTISTAANANPNVYTDIVSDYPYEGHLGNEDFP